MIKNLIKICIALQIGLLSGGFIINRDFLESLFIILCLSINIMSYGDVERTSK